ncbi:MAG: diguanylate cyclase [Burkholderiaceae bacterium]|nr:MAG: diguanylate cyclase [Burkholderiaceae bacterium]
MEYQNLLFLIVTWLEQCPVVIARPLIRISRFDIDRFKIVNDTFGRAMGDQVPIAMARRSLRDSHA